MKLNINDFNWDDMFGDIYVFNMETNDWQKLISFLNDKTTDIQYYKGEHLIHLTSDLIKQYIENNDFPELHFTIKVDSIELNTHIFTIDELELCFDPKDVQEKPKVKSLFNFLSLLAIHLNKEVIITNENNRQKSLITFQTSGDVVY